MKALGVWAAQYITDEQIQCSKLIDFHTLLQKPLSPFQIMNIN